MVRCHGPRPGPETHSAADTCSLWSPPRMIRTLFAFLLAAVLMVSVPMFAQTSSKPAEIIFINGDIYTQATPARAQALAVRDGRIVAVGTNDEIGKLKGAQTKVVDLGRHFFMPGFNDAHLHLASGGFEKLNVNLVGSRTLQEMQQRIRPKASRSPEGEWVA